jgi:Cu/Ag efflux protein CusF
MGAMEMDFTVQDAKMLAGLKAGDAVHGKLKVKDSNRVITELQKH